jgi:NAD(P)H dehydrogenase (quinone)
MNMVKLAIVYHSKDGHTKVVAEAIKKGAYNVPDVEVFLVNCEETDLEVLDNSDAIIFGCPTYMGSASAQLKKFMDSSSDSWWNQKWRNKIAAGFTNATALNGDKYSTLMQIFTFAAQHGMIWVGLDLKAGVSSSKNTGEELNRLGSWIGLMTQSNSDQGPELSPPPSDRLTAEYFGERIANITKKFMHKE